jgi:hypothetical protein
MTAPQRSLAVGYGAAHRVELPAPPPEHPAAIVSTPGVTLIWDLSPPHPTTPPPGWETLAFDDSGWPVAVEVGGPVTPPTRATVWYNATGASRSDDWAVPVALVRHHFHLDAGTITDATFNVYTDDDNPDMYINGTRIGGRIGYAGEQQIFACHGPLITGGENVIALSVGNHGGEAHTAFRLDLVWAP